MDNAIVALVRGYDTLGGYQMLIERNAAIKHFINQDNQYPLVLFHEGNIKPEDKKYVEDFSGGQTIKWVDISPVWQGGYEAMCQFQTFHLWNYCREYDLVMRIDEDCIIRACETDPFEQMGSNVYLKTVYWAESHSETNATLPEKIREHTGANPEEFYNHKFPYTNVSVARVSFFTERRMNDLLYLIAMCPDQRKYRWGDLPVLGSLLNIFAKGRVGTTEGLVYGHISHNNVITSA